MPTVADCLRQHAPAYLAKFGDAVPTGHRKVLGALMVSKDGSELKGKVTRSLKSGKTRSRKVLFTRSESRPRCRKTGPVT